VAIEFCTEIEDLVTELSLTDWYDHGRNIHWHYVYTFLTEFTILKRLGATVRKWREDVYELLRRFPSFTYESDEYCSLIQGKLDRYDT
jgi:hypothetical protein